MFYEYKCLICEYIEEIQHGMNESPKFDCPYCEVAMKRVITGGCGVHYKGIGFYGNKTIDAPRAKHFYQKTLVGPKFMKDAFKR